MSMSLNTDLARMFETMAAVMELRGEPVFKAIAFGKVGRMLEDSTVDLRKAVEEGTLEDIEGIGKSSRKVIEDYVKTGKSVDYEELIVTVPAGLIEMIKLPGLGPKTARLFWTERGINSIDELAVAIDAGKLDGLKGVGEKKIAQLKESLAMRATAGTRFGLPDALEIAELMLERVKSFGGIAKAEIGGSLRRRKETIGDADLIVCLDDPKRALELSKFFIESPGVRKVIGQGISKSSVQMESGLQVDLRVVPTDSFGATLQYFTGSKDHNVKVRGLALDKGLTLNEWGLFKIDEWDKFRETHPTLNKAESIAALAKVRAIASKSEADVYKALGLAYVEPELRENRGEVEAAIAGTLPTLIERADIKGELHCHTTASDGTASIEEMAEAAKTLGYEYIVITDHSPSQVIARGLEPARLKKQIADVRKAKVKGITILVGSEVDILVDGRLDYEDALLAELDFVVASPHVSLRQETEKATARILKAIENKYVNVIGHPTGRLVNKRPGLELDWTKIFKAATDSGTALEINAGWPRLDLNDINARGAIAAGVTLTIDTDAHSTEGLDEIIFGIGVARRAGAEKKHVLNTRPLAQVKKWVEAKR
jgi:DNA polymerase (family X)